MQAVDEVFRSGNPKKVWQKYCGFLDLSLTESTELQEELLMQQIELVHDSPLAKKFMAEKPKSLSGFRQIVPLTTYEDYAPYLGNKNEDTLAVKNCIWVCTSGRGGFRKWVPLTEEGLNMYAHGVIATAILACTEKKGEVNIGVGSRVLQNLPPSPYAASVYVRKLVEMMGVRLIPDYDAYEKEDFQARIQAGFAMALRTGADVLSSLSSVLIKVGERFAESSGQLKMNRRMLQPQIALRLLRAWLKSKQQGRSMLPKDIWPLKGILSYGTDTEIYRNKIIYYWGKDPLQIYSATEAGVVATQAWNRKGMTFVPHSCFREFIPEDEWLKSREDKTYQPSTVLLDQVETGKLYEVVITSFYGMPFLRYRLGDLIRIIALKDEEAGINLPQMIFESRADDLIDLAGFSRLDEKTIWQAIANTGVKYEDWSIRKEYDRDRPLLRLYIELKEEIQEAELGELIQQELVSINPDYADLEKMLTTRPLRVTSLPAGSFQQYYEKKKKSGADLAHLKPAHMNASDAIIKDLLSLMCN